MTLHQVLSAARERLVAADISSGDAAIDVDLFARTILGWDQVRLIVERTSPVPPGLESRLSEWVLRRVNREPSAYIVNVREFWGLDFLVSPAVLIPRPETEFIIEETLRLVAEGLTGLHDKGGPPQQQRALGHTASGGKESAALHQDREMPAAVTAARMPGLRIADIGTGSGCLAVSLARELPDCSIVATDVSAEALAVARENAVRHGVATRIQFVATSYLGGIEGDFDIIVANPPYVREGDKPALAADVRHEPDVALFGGASGLRAIEGVLDTAIATLRRRGWLLMEFGFGQEEDVRNLVATRPPLRVERIREDLQGIPRTAIVQRES